MNQVGDVSQTEKVGDFLGERHEGERSIHGGS
jgi:hypothetical protein